MWIMFLKTNIKYVLRSTAYGRAVLVHIYLFKQTLKIRDKTSNNIS